MALEVQRTEVAADHPVPTPLQRRPQASPAAGQVQDEAAFRQRKESRQGRALLERFPLLVAVDLEIEGMIKVSSEPFHGKYIVAHPCPDKFFLEIPPKSRSNDSLT
jgi:hypothetical protein